jgi:hypothetical protein
MKLLSLVDTAQSDIADKRALTTHASRSRLFTWNEQGAGFDALPAG